MGCQQPWYDYLLRCRVQQARLLDATARSPPTHHFKGDASGSFVLRCIGGRATDVTLQRAWVISRTGFTSHPLPKVVPDPRSSPHDGSGDVPHPLVQDRQHREPRCCGRDSFTLATPGSPMRWPGERGRHPRAGVALCRVELGLDEKDAPGEVSTAEVGSSEVGADDVGHPQVGTLQISSDEVCPPQTGPSEVYALQVGSYEVGSPVVLLVRDVGSHELARAQEQAVDVSPMCCNVQLQECIGAVAREPFGL